MQKNDTINYIKKGKNSKPNGITKADREARKSDDLLERDFTSLEPLKTDRTPLSYTMTLPKVYNITADKTNRVAAKIVNVKI